jgi:predicted glycosyltransferase
MSAQVLIIEDEVILASNLSASLARAGVTSHVANSLTAAASKVAANDYALICADIQLGDGNGLEFCEQVRAVRPELPVIMMTGQDTSGNRLRAEGLGATAFMAKPFALSRFRELVATLLREKPASGECHSGQRPPCVLMYSHDTIGLGHMRRNSAIAARIVARDPRASVLMMVGSPSGVPFDLPAGVDYIKLPSLTKVARDVWRPQSLRITSGDVMSLRASLIEHAAESFRPDVMLIDHEPGGIWNELIPAFEAIRQSKPEARIILGLRDILDEPGLTRQVWEKRGTSEIVRKYYNDILVYGDETIFPSRAAYGLDALAPGRVRSCGYVTNFSRVREPSPELRMAQRPRIVLAGGGGRDAFPLLSAASEALQLIPPSLRPEADIIAGPLMDAELRQPLERGATSDGIRFHRTHSNMQGLLDQADLFVTMAGYNSIVEAIATGCRTLVVPRVGPSAEQRMRASCLSQLGIIETIDPQEATPAALAAVFGTVGKTPRRRHGIDLDGAERAAEFIGDAIIDQTNQTRVNHARTA